MKTKKRKLNKINKKAVSLITAAVLLTSSLPVSDMLDVTKKAYGGITAWAAANQTYDLSGIYDSINNYYNLRNESDFVTYSLAYQQSPETYFDKNITINFPQNAELSDFASIGTSDYPFKGTIYISSTNNNGLILNKALFDYVSDSCKIQDLNSKTATPITLSRQDGGSGALFANNVIHDETNTDGGEIQIIAASKSLDENPNNGTFSGFIGTLGESAKLDLTVTNNTGSTEITGSEDTGLVCGTMGENSSLTVTVAGGKNTSYSVTSTGGNAGGLVGSMGEASTLTVKSDVNTTGTITAESGYAGGLVGYAENAVVNFSENDTVTVSGTVSGSSGSGGVFGYYENGEGSTFNVTNYNVNCTVNGDNSGGRSGGIFGELKNSGNISIDKTNTIIAKGNGKNFGGLVGLYNAKNSSDTLVINGNETEDLKVTVTRNGTATNYGGVIGATESNAYVKCSDVTVNAKGCNSGVTSFGGFIGSNGGGMLDLKDLTVVQNDGNNAFLGGGVVGNMTAGVLQLSGTTDLSATKCDATGKGKYGQIVGIRGNQTLIYALNGWTLIRSTNPVQADDIGTWGEVLRFSDRFKIADVLDVSESDHTVTVKNIPVTDTSTNAVTVSSVEEFAIVALNLKAKNTTISDTNNALKFSNTDSLKNVDASAKLNMTLTSDIDLTGTGITGLYRDDGCNAKGDNGVFDFKGSIIGEKDENGNYPTVTLAAGEPYGKRKKDSNSEAVIIDSNDDTDGNGRIYCHRYSGFISKIYGNSEFKNFNINGIINIQSKSSASDMFVGSVAAQSVTDSATDKVIFENVNTDVKINVICKDNISTRCGGLIGELYYTRDEIKITGCKISSDISISNTNDNRVYAGGVFGNILATRPNVSVNIESSEINAKIENTENSNSNYKKVTAGGLIANIAGNDNQSSKRTIKLNNVTLDGVQISNCNGSALLGSTWCNVDVTFGGEAGGLSVNNCKLTGGNSDFAGLVTQGSGYWQVNDVDINNINVSGESGAGAFGMFVNKGHTNYTYNSTSYSKSLYLEFKNKNAYSISDDTITLSNSSPKFDEILVYANSDIKIAAADGNCAVVSISTAETGSTAEPKVFMDGENCNTYQNQTEYAKTTDTTKKFNPYVRYYYNLDYIRANKSTNADKLLLWSVNRYAHESIKSYFESGFIKTTTNEDGTESEISTIPAGTYDMKGYSYYPVDINGTVKINGAEDKPAVFTFCNNEFDTSELTGDSKRITYDTSKNQHYLMQSGLFRNCSGSLTVNYASFKGNVSKAFNGTDEIKESGALICGYVAGTVESPATVECNSIVLDGISVNDADTTDIKITYAPLFINRIDHDAKLTINGISTTAAYNEDGSTKTAAGCLIGNVGANDYDNANNIKLVFNNIKLDSRAKRFTDDSLNSAFDEAYNTKNSIFKNATILNAFSYPEGNNCSAIYNYKYSEDWDENGSALHNVTYGKEITVSEQYQENGISLERNYLNSPYYTDPKTPKNTTDPYNFDNGYFLPYVKEEYGTRSEKNYYEIKVNVASPNLNKGCGTYNDPYIIEKANQLMLVADILGGVDTFSDGTVINYRENNYNTWCDEKTDKSHCMYVWDSATSKFYPPKMENREIVKDVLGNPIPDMTGTAVELDDIKEALSTAYYQLSGDITLSASFTGLGKTTPFMGVIDGNNKTITNQSVNPLIYNSTGSVVKNLTLDVTASSISLTAPTAKSAYDTDGSGGTQFYGGLIGIVNGGDNIIDNVSLTFSDQTTITVSGSSNYSGNVAVGGYIGVVRYGGVIFRNMSGASKTGLTSSVCSNVSESSKNFLYINPIIGRVIDGYAITETGKYTPREDSKPTMQNGTKNYSVADINSTTTNKISISDDQIISVPDGQSLFLMGCITNSGAGKLDASLSKYKSDYNLFGYGKTNQMVRHGSYASVGTETKTDFESNVKSGDCFGGSVVPYLIYQYTKKGEDSTCEYPARTLTSNTAAFYISLAQNENYNLPDGFRGIGSVNDTSDGSQMYIHGINGNGSTVNMNIQYQMYNNGTDYYDTENSGIGLFNTFCQNGSSFIGEDFETLPDKYTISDITISGNVSLKRYNNSGVETTTNNGTISAGGLGGSCNSGECTIQLENISLNGLTVSSTYNSGGLLGTAEPETAVTASLKCISADGLSVTAARQAGGFVGYSKNITYTVDGKGSNDSNSSFKINTIELTDTDDKRVSDSQPVPRAAGGLFGLFDEKARLTLSDMDIERYGEKGVIELGSGVTLKENCLGGIIGYMNNSGDVKIDGCNVKNINIQNGSRCGGLIGIVYNNSAVVENSIVIQNTNVIGEKSEISSSCPSGYSYANSGGLCGYSNTTITIDGCSVEGYTISSERSEGCAGFVTKSDGTLTASNSLVKDCTLKQSGSNRVGAFLGCNGGTGFTGYNLVSYNVQMTDFSGKALSSVGDIVGNNNSKTLQLVGVSVQKNEDGKYASNSVGASFSSSNGYVIYSDYNGDCCGATPNTIASEINRSETADVTYSYPYATINPKTNIDGSMFLTSDGVSGKTTVEEILADTVRYTNVSADKTAFAKYTDKLSTFNAEMGTSLAVNFPVLVVNDSSKTNVTKMINSYIHLLTNDTSMDNYSADVSGKYTVDISKYRMENGSDTFTKVTDEDDKPTLTRNGSVFSMSDLDYDSNHTQFTLIDVQYYAPNDTTKVAYHLYIPVLVEKMLKFDFKAEILTGTTYNVDAYKDHKIVMESYGNPVTMHVSYSYKRTLSEWQNAIDLGENLLGNYGKTVLLTSGSQNHLPKETDLVLVDRNNGDRAYYSTMNEAFTSADNKLSFNKFKTADESTSFKPVSLLDLLSLSANISATEDTENGKYIVCESTDANAAVKVDDTYYKLKPEESTETAYSITISAKDSAVTDSTILPVEEDYYISFFTPGNTSAEMVDITAKSAAKLDDTGMKTPSHITSSNIPAQMILGDLYDQSFEFKATNQTEVMSETNNSLGASLQTTITIKEADRGVIQSYLSDNNIKVYHGFVIDLQRTDSSGTEKGVKGDPFVSGVYVINSTSYNINETCSASSIELSAVYSGETVDISKILASASEVVIRCNNLKINYNTAGILEQFPVRPDGNQSFGVTMSAASNLAYAPENILHSNISRQAGDDRYKYYRQGDVSVAKLNYNIPTGTADADEFSKLGINGNVSPEDITAVGYYDVSELPEEDVNNAKKVSVKLELMQKQNDGTYTAVDDMNKYLDNISLYSSDNSTVNAAVSGNSCSYVFDKNVLDLENSIFTIRSGYTVKTGSEFENENLLYSNYKVLMTVHLLDENGDIITNSGCYDYIIYTNAKIYTEFLKTAV